MIGGCLLTGGYGSAIGAFFGAIIFGMVLIGLSYTQIDQDWYLVFLGGMLLVAVLFNNMIRKRATGRAVMSAAQSNGQIAGPHATTSKSTSATSSRLPASPSMCCAGECHCLLGDNGAGKSTFIKTMSGVHKPTTGEMFGRRQAGASSTSRAMP